MRKFLHLFLSLVLSTSPAFAQVNSDGTNSSSDYGPNFLVNGDFYRSVLVGTSSRTNVNLTSGTLATTGFNLGLKHLVVSQGTNAASSFALDIDFAKLNDGYTKTSKQCTLRFDYFLDEVGTGTWQTHVGTSTSAASSSIITLTPTYSSLLGGDQKAGSVLIPFPCSKLLTDKVWIYKAAGGSRAFNLGKVYVSYEKGPLGYIQPPNTFTAFVSSTGVVSSEGPEDWISGNCTNAAPSVCTFVASKFTNTPNCQLSTNNITGAVSIPTIPSVSSSSITLRVTNGAGTVVANDYTLTCTKTGTDYAKPALTVQDMDFSDRPYTPAITGVPYTNIKFFYSRVNDRMYVRGSLTVTGASTGFINIPFPSGLNADSTKIEGAGGSSTYTYSGVANAYQTNNTVGRPALNSTSLNTVVIYGPTSGSAWGNAVPSTWANGHTLSVSFDYPIQGWGAVTAPPIAGLVMAPNPNSLGVKKFFSWTFSGSTPATPCSTAGNCTLTNNLDGVLTSFVRGGTVGVYTANLVPGVCSTIPQCSSMAEDGGQARRIVKRTSDSWTTTQLFFFGIQTSAADTSGDIMCTCY